MPLIVARAALVATAFARSNCGILTTAPLPPFTPGAHVTVRTPNGLLRKYSLSNDSSERDRYVIAVKREASGRGGRRVSSTIAMWARASLLARRGTISS